MVRQSQPARPSEDALNAMAGRCLSMQVRLLNRVITSVYEDAMRPLGLKSSQLSILVAAWKMGTATPQKVCEVLHLDPSTLSRNVERMRAKGWLETVPADDARAQPFRLTDAGRKLLLKAIPYWENAQEAATKLLGDSTIDALGNTVKSLGKSATPG